jgi:hypothetical protein
MNESDSNNVQDIIGISKPRQNQATLGSDSTLMDYHPNDKYADAV